MKHRWGKGLENLSVWIGSLIFLVWFICMGCLTAFAAQSILEYEREQCKLDHEEYEFALSHIDSTKAALPGYEEYCLWELASRGGLAFWILLE